MPRKVRDSNLETRTARARLAASAKPYFRLIEPGLHLGYRKLARSPGSWVARRYAGNGSYTVKNLTTAENEPIIADDFSNADGRTVLNFSQAQEAAKKILRAAPAGPYTVAEAMDAYLEHLENDGRAPYSIRDARYRINGFINPKLGDLEIHKLTVQQFKKWRDDLAKAPARLRTAKDKGQKHDTRPDTADAKRARRASANRIWTLLRAALNLAFQNDKVASDAAWRKVKPFENVDASRSRYLTIAEAKRLINACESDFRRLVEAALQTGARYSELARLKVSSFNPDAGGTIEIRLSKSGKARYIHLTDEGRAFFKQLCAGHAGDETMLRKADGTEWNSANQSRPMIDAVTRAKIRPPISFHGLRHTWASHAVMNGVPLLVVAGNLGHADTRMVEKHYGHLAPSFVAEAIRAGAPKFGFKPDKKLASLHG